MNFDTFEMTSPSRYGTVDVLRVPTRQRRFGDQIAIVQQQIEHHQGIIRDQEASIQRLRAQLNLFAPVCSLPMEVLAHIFLLCISKQSSGQKERKRKQISMPWLVSFSHVCQCWREACLQTAGLWSTVTDSLPGKWPTVFLERSGRVPLRVKLTLNRHSSETVDLVLANMHRMRILSIYGDTVADVVSFVNELSTPAPMLQDAEVHAVKGGYKGDAADSVLFAGVAPKLRSLKLLGDPAIVSDVPSFSALTDFNSQCVLSISGALQFLQQNPGIECLRMVDPDFNAYAPPPEPIELTPIESSIIMPHLHSMFIKALSVARITTFLRTVETPELNTLLVGVHIPVVTESLPTRSINETLLDMLASRVSAAQEHMGPQRMGQFRSLTLDFDPLGKFSIIARSRGLPRLVTSLVEEHNPASQLLDLSLSWRSSRDYRPNNSKFTLLQVMDLVFTDNRFAFDTIRVLILTNDLSGYLTSIDVPKYEWSLYFRPLVYTKILWFSDRSPDPALLEAATPPLPDAEDPEEQAKSFIFPLLREVHITFEETRNRPSLVEAWPSLQRLAKARKQGNARLVIQLEHCKVADSMLESLREDAWVLQDGQPLPEGAEMLT